MMALEAVVCVMLLAGWRSVVHMASICGSWMVGPLGARHVYVVVRDPSSRLMSSLPRSLYDKFELQVGNPINGSCHLQSAEGYQPSWPRNETRKVSWLRFRGVQAFPFAGLLINGYVYHPDGLSGEVRQNNNNANFPKWRSSGIFKEFRVDCLLNFMHWGHQYGHYLIDYLPLAMTLSKDLRSKAHIMLPRDSRFARNFMNLFGFTNDQLVFAAPSEIYFADVLYTTQELHCQLMFISLIERVRRFFVSVLKLDVATPTRYVLYNRVTNRIIQNMPTILSFLQNRFPNLYFDVYREEDRMNLPQPMRWADKLLFFNEIMFCFGMHGSGTLNVLFMQANTVMMVIETRGSWASLFPGIARIRNMYLYAVRDVGLSNHWQKERKLPLKELKILEMLTEAVAKAYMISNEWSRPSTLLPPLPVLYSNGKIRYYP